MDYQLDYRTVNTLWSSVLAETLARLGLETAVLCPGSRSSPLTLALAPHPRIHTLAILDERSAAFFALGRARCSQKPVVLVCTSGTAAANFFPAIIEAKESQVPLIVLTGDRPPELRHCHAGQTIDQVKLYGHYPQWQTELAPPAADPEQLRYLRQTLVYAWERSLFPQKGVVHLNCPFREPLAPTTQDLPTAIAPELETHFFQTVQPVNPSPLLSTLPVLPTFPTKGIIIAGLYQGAEPEQYCRHIQQLSQGLSYPVLGEALSPVRNHFRRDYPLISHYDWGLRNAALAEVLTPEIVLQIGELPTSKVLRHWLTGLHCPRYIITHSQENFDPLHTQSYHLRTSLGTLVESILANLATNPRAKSLDSRSYVNSWRELDQKAQYRLNQCLSQETILREGKIAELLSQYLPPETPLMIANSMPVRYMELFWQKNNRRYQPYFSRGANGIDGTLATALGIAQGSRPTVLFTGDLSLLHDTNGFLIGPQFQGSLTIILLNNHGGGIFEMLPIGNLADRDMFERYFATPQQVDFAQLCAVYGVKYQLITSQSALISQIQTLPTSGIQLLEIPSDRHQEAQWLKTIGAQFTQMDWLNPLSVTEID